MWCDFGGVLTEPMSQVVERFCVLSGVPAEKLFGAVNAVAAEYGMTELEPLERGVLSQEVWGRQLAQQLGSTVRPGIDLTDFGRYWYAERRFNRALFDVLQARRARGWRIGLLTNSVREWEPFRQALLPYPDAFDAAIRSHEIGLRKPDARIYAKAEETFGVSGADCLLIDDSPANCHAARDRGWRAVRHVTNETTLAALASN